VASSASVANVDRIRVMATHATPPAYAPAPSGLEAHCRYLDDVLVFQTANGGPFLRSLELEYAVRHLTRAWVRAGLSLRAIGPWLRFAVESAAGEGAGSAVVTAGLLRWAVDEAGSPRRSDVAVLTGGAA
jgi:hypothetical protein